MAHARHHEHRGESLNTPAFAATVHCLTGCALGEVLGMVLGTAFGWSNGATLGSAAYPVNRRLIARGKGHAVMHAHH